jgi:uncharacterized protein YjbJ (UPF0337 family)
MMEQCLKLSWDDVSANWNDYRGAVRRRWSKLKNEDLDQIQGTRDLLVASIQKRYGINTDEAHQQIEEWLEVLE